MLRKQIYQTALINIQLMLQLPLWHWKFAPDGLETNQSRCSGPLKSPSHAQETHKYPGKDRRHQWAKKTPKKRI